MVDLEIKNEDLFSNTGIRNEECLENSIPILCCQLKDILSLSKNRALLCET